MISQGQSWLTGFQQKLRELGWSDGRDIQIDVIWGGAEIEHIRTSAAEMVRSKPDIILVYSVRVLNEVRRRTAEIPVVFIATNDPVGLGIVKSLSHPGGNLTGFMFTKSRLLASWWSFSRRWCRILQEWLSSLTRTTAARSSTGSLLRRLQSPLALLRSRFPCTTPPASKMLLMHSRVTDGGLVLPTDVTITAYRDLIVELAARHRLPVVYWFRSVVAGGGLMSYGPDTSDLFLRAASYIDRILKGEKPADLPVQAPTKFTLAINLKTAKALGLTVPRSMLLSADEVIE